MSWKDLTAYVPLDPDVDFDDEILGWERDELWPDLDDEGDIDDEDLDSREKDDFQIVIEPLDPLDPFEKLLIMEEQLIPEIKALVCRQDISHLIAAYRRSRSRHDLIDVYWLSKSDGFPFYRPAAYFMYRLEELQEEVNPIPFDEMPLFVAFAEDFHAVLQSVRDEICATKGQLLRAQYGTDRPADVSGLDDLIRNQIVMRIIIEGERAILAES